MISATDGTEAVLARTVQWDSLLNSRLVTETDVKLIRAYDGQGPLARRAFLEQSGPDLAQALLNVLRNVSHQDTTDYVLCLIVEMFVEDKTNAVYFHRAPGTHEGDAYADLFRVLAKPHWFAQEKALFCLSHLVGARLGKDLGLSAVAAACGGDQAPSVNAKPMGVAAQTVVQLVQWMCAQLRSPSHATRSVPSVVAALASMLVVRDVRPLVTHSGGVELLAPLLLPTSVASSTLSAYSSQNEVPKRDVQLLYEVALCAWLLTFHPPALAAMRRNGAFTLGLVDVAKRATKEKVARVSVLALRNIAEGVGERSANSGGAGAAGVSTSSPPLRGVDEASLLKTLTNLSQRGFVDEELVVALEDLRCGSIARSRDASGWDVYVAELRSGSMSWTSAHCDEAFWRENACKLTDNNCALLRVLITLLVPEAATSGDRPSMESGGSSTTPSMHVSSKTLAVACHDVGEFATHYPAGRFLVTDLGGKEKTMALLTHPDDEVRKHALLCTQKLLVANWRFIGREGEN